MRQLEINKTQFRVSDFLSWQRDDSLILSPYFQRRPVWKPEAKSFFVDTVLRGLPAPVIYLRERIDVDSQKSLREIVDGQQRLRTLFTFIDPEMLRDFDPQRDPFSLKSVHNAEFAGKTFDQLPKTVKLKILGYEFSTHILPTEVEDREILQIFARLNATGMKLNHQELRNAEWFGEFKTVMYMLALEQLDRWRNWMILTEDQIAGMREVELTSDLVMNMLDGLTGKTQKRIDVIYRKYDESLPRQSEISRRFRLTMEEIEKLIGDRISRTVFSSEVYFFTLFVFIYELLFGLGSSLARGRPRRLPSGLRDILLKASDDLRGERVPERVLDAVRRASADFGRRDVRLKYLQSLL